MIDTISLKDVLIFTYLLTCGKNILLLWGGGGGGGNCLGVNDCLYYGGKVGL